MFASWYIYFYLSSRLDRSPRTALLFGLYGCWKKLLLTNSLKSDTNTLYQMVSWKDIEHAIQSNPDRNRTVDTLESKPVETPVEQFALADTDATVVPVSAVAPVHSVPTVMSVEPVATVTALAPQQETPKIKEPVTQNYEVDPIVIGIEERDILYTGVSKRAKHQMECEEAQNLEGMLSDLYKSQGGRSRGWTKTSLDLMIKPRCASGGNIKELDRAKQAFTWQLVGDNKEHSAFLDFVCVAKKIRIAVWFTEEKHVLVYPAADYAGVEEISHYPLYHVDSKGHIRRGFNKGSDLVNFCDSNKYVMLPPISVMNSLSKLCMDELESVANKLGMTDVDGKKSERVAKIAMYKLHQRLH